MLVERLAPTLKEPTCRSEQDEDCTFAGRTTSGRVTTRFRRARHPRHGARLGGGREGLRQPDRVCERALGAADSVNGNQNPRVHSVLLLEIEVLKRVLKRVSKRGSQRSPGRRR
jgi:hypothetical protein